MHKLGDKREKVEELRRSSWPPNELESVNCCPVCNGEKRKLLHRELVDGIFFCAEGEWSLYGCEQCDSAYLDPRPTASSIHRAYSSYYTHEPEQTTGAKLSPLRQFMRRAANGYRNRRFGSQYLPASDLASSVITFLPRLKANINRQFRYLPRTIPQPKSVLDVGFGGGAFLKRAADAGWRVLGVDPDPVAVANAEKLGLDVKQGGIEVARDFGEQFSYITLNHVIEHVYEPIETLRCAFELLSPGGELWIETPNVLSFGHAIYGSSWFGLDPPRHLVLFNWTSMTESLQEVGFREIRRVPTPGAASWLFTVSGRVRDRLDPYQKSVRRFQDVAMANAAASCSLLQKDRTELICLKATRP